MLNFVKTDLKVSLRTLTHTPHAIRTSKWRLKKSKFLMEEQTCIPAMPVV